MLAAGSSGQTLVLHLQGLGFVCSLWDHGDSRLRPMSLRRLRLMSLQASRGRCTGPGQLRGRQDRAAAVRPETLVQRRHENGAGVRVCPAMTALLWLAPAAGRALPGRVGAGSSRRHSAAPNGSRCASEPVCQTRTGVRANAAVAAGDICGNVVAATDGDPARPSESPTRPPTRSPVHLTPLTQADPSPRAPARRVRACIAVGSAGGEATSFQPPCASRPDPRPVPGPPSESAGRAGQPTDARETRCAGRGGGASHAEAPARPQRRHPCR